MPKHSEDWQVHPGALGPGTEVGSWRVVERLGVGGYGAVYRVEDLAHPGDFYALKLALRPGDARAEREVNLLRSRAVHPNVVRLHACGRWPHPRTGYLYFVMDWVRGPALHTWVETVNPTFRQLAEKVGKVAVALGALHDRGVLHRDFKPEHVLIREQDGEPILLDFGVGRYAGAETLTTAVLPPATPHLLSPEAVRFFLGHHKHPGARYEARATDDLHALGVCLYRLVTGHWPFSPELPPDLLYMQLEAVMPSAPSAFNRRVPRAFSDVILRLLAKKPRARFQSGHEVRAALVAAVALGDAERWDAPVFEWEDAAGDVSTEGAARRIRRPEGPTESRTPPPRELVLGPVLSMTGVHGRSSRGASARGRVARRHGAGRRGWPLSAVLVAALGFAVLGATVRGAWPRASLTEASFVSSEGRVAGLLPGSSGHEVAREVERSETAAAATPPLATLTPAAVATPATHAKDEAAVKKKPSAVSSSFATQHKAPRLGSVGKALCVGATSAALACSGADASVRPSRPAAPAPESCPPGAVETMQRLRLRMGSSHPVTFTGERETITVQEGEGSILLVGDRGELPDGTRFFGKLLFGDTRVFGRFTEAQTPGGDRFPVCLVLENLTGVRGLAREGDAGPDSTRVSPAGALRVVREFK